MSPERGGRIAVGVIFATIFLDFIGFSILIPVLPPYLAKLGFSGGQVGLILALYIIGLVLFLPLWGWISDRVGRRPVILLCLIGTSASFILLGLSTSLWVFCLARALGGFFGASVGTAQAYMTDITDHDERAEGFGLIGAAAGAGMVFGPAIGGLLNRGGPLLPFYVPALVAGINFLMASLFLPESRAARPNSASPQGLLRALIPTPFLIFARAHDNRTRLYLYLFFHLFTAFSALEAMFPMFAADRLGWDALATGLFLGYIGVIWGVTQGVLVGPLSRSVGESPLVILGLALTGGCMLSLGGASSTLTVGAAGLGVALGNGLCFPTFISLFSKNCGSEEEAGEYLAHSQSMSQTGRGLGFLWGGWALEHIGISAPFVFGGLGVIAGLILFVTLRHYLVPARERPPVSHLVSR